MNWSQADWIAAHRSDLDEIAYLEAELARIKSRVKLREMTLPGVREERLQARRLRDAKRIAHDNAPRAT